MMDYVKITTVTCLGREFRIGHWKNNYGIYDVKTKKFMIQYKWDIDWYGISFDFFTVYMKGDVYFVNGEKTVIHLLHPYRDLLELPSSGKLRLEVSSMYTLYWGENIKYRDSDLKQLIWKFKKYHSIGL